MRPFLGTHATACDYCLSFPFHLKHRLHRQARHHALRDQYGVGDQIKVLDIEGVVEKVGLRITTIRDKKNVLWYVRNGEILVIGNGSQKR